MSKVRVMMDIHDRLQVEKLLELLYERQAARVRPEMRHRCGPLQETAELIIRFKEMAIEDLSKDLGMDDPAACDECGGECHDVKEYRLRRPVEECVTAY